MENTGRCHFENRARGPCAGQVRPVVTPVTQGPLWDLILNGNMKRVVMPLCTFHEVVVRTEGLCPPACEGWCRTDPAILAQLAGGHA